ncbi:MAG: rod shape-determining protein MreC [Oligoflexia bacterium]|nr:rod shape-determining protein MreC [Oligoflexia bacterium]
MFGFFELDLKKLLLVILILALPLISVNLERRDSDTGPRWYEQPVLWIVHPTQEFFSKFALGVSHTTSHYLNLVNIKTENRVSKEEVLKLKQDLAQVVEVKLENSRLKQQLQFQEESPNNLLGAQVIGVDLWGEYSSLNINKGSDHGIIKGMAVITREGAVGYILNSSAKYATVLALTDQNAVIDVLVQRTRARGISEGIGRDLCRIKYLQRTDDVQIGDLVITSGFDGIFPKGFPVGLVTKVSKKNYGVTQNVEMRPVVDTNRLEEVFIVIAPDIRESKLTPTDTDADKLAEKPSDKPVEKTIDKVPVKAKPTQ